MALAFSIPPAILAIADEVIEKRSALRLTFHARKTTHR